MRTFTAALNTAKISASIMLKPIRERLRGLNHKQITMFAVIAAVAATGVSLMALTRAATSIKSTEIESGILTGQSRVTKDSGASGGLFSTEHPDSSLVECTRCENYMRSVKNAIS